MTPPPHTNLGSRDLPPPASVRLDTDSARRLLGALGAAERDGLEEGDFDGVALPGYTLVRRLGAGASGEVFLALREGSDRPVSVKVWRQGQRGERAVRAWRELDLLGECNLSVVPRVLDYGTRAGSLFVATDYIDGLNPIARAAEMSLRERVTLLADIADAVQMLHEHGIIHRDLKPANILVTAAGRVFILDLGLAMLAQRTADTLTLEGQPVGTLGYMSPEQARGERAKVSVRSDVYSLGAIGYELLCGQTPHATEGGASETLLRIATGPASGAAVLSPDLPAPLAAVLEKSVRFEPAERYASAADFAADLRRWSKGERVLATPPRRWQKVMEWAGKHPKATTALLCAVIVVTSVGSTLWSLWYYRNKPALVTHDLEWHQWARLESLGGKELASWNSERDGNVTFAQRVDIPASLGGGMGVLFAFGDESRIGLPARITLVRGDDPRGAPVWQKTSKDLTIPPLPNDPDGLEHAARVAVGFLPAALVLADVCPDVPGPEAIVSFASSAYGTTCVCVIDMTGTMRYEAWHTGHVQDVTWLSGPRRIVCLGVCNKSTWTELGVSKITEEYPTCMFALDVDSGDVKGWIDPTSPGGGVAWYKFLAPAAAERTLGMQRRTFGSLPSALGLDPSTMFRGTVQRASDIAVGVNWILNQNGEDVPVVGHEKFHSHTQSIAEDLVKADPRWENWADFQLTIQREIESTRSMPVDEPR